MVGGNPEDNRMALEENQVRLSVNQTDSGDAQQVGLILIKRQVLLEGL